MYTVTWERAQSRCVKMEKEQLKCDRARVRKRKRKQRDTASEESKTRRKSLTDRKK